MMGQEQNALHCDFASCTFTVMSSSTAAQSNMTAISHCGSLSLSVD